MFEHHKAPLLPRSAFLRRVAWGALISLSIVVFSLGIGMLGYHYLEDLPWVDAYADAAMILSGMGPLHPLQTTAGKLFAGSYALFSGLAFITIVAAMFGPIVHRFFHALHLDSDEEESRGGRKKHGK